MFANPGLFIVTRHTVLSHSQPLSVIAHKHALALCQSKWHYIAVIPDCVTLKPQFVCWLPDPSLNFYTHPTSPVPLSLWEHEQTLFFYYCGKFKDTTQFPPPAWFLPSSARESTGPWGHRAAPWSVRPESQDVEVACLGAVAGNRTWEERIVKALMSGFPTSAPLGWKEQATHTHTHTHTHLCQTTVKGLRPELHSTGSTATLKGRQKRNLIKDSVSLFGSHVASNLVWQRAGSLGGRGGGLALQVSGHAGSYQEQQFDSAETAGVMSALILSEEVVLTLAVVFAASRMGGVRLVLFPP